MIKLGRGLTWLTMGTISTIVPMVSHVDHTEHDTQILITENGWRSARPLAKQRARLIIDNCATAAMSAGGPGCSRLGQGFFEKYCANGIKSLLQRLSDRTHLFVLRALDLKSRSWKNR